MVMLRATYHILGLIGTQRGERKMLNLNIVCQLLTGANSFYYINMLLFFPLTCEISVFSFHFLAS